MHTIITPLSLVVLLAFTAPAEANTRFGFGTIVAVDATGEQGRKNQPGFTVCYEWFNLSATAVLKHSFYTMEEKTRHGHRVYYLDGQPSTWQEALKVGRAVCVSDNEQVCWVSSRPGPQAELSEATAADCWLQLSLKSGFSTTAAKVNKGTVGEMQPFGCEVLLLVDIRGGAIAGAAAIIPALDGADFAIDHSRLSYSDGKIGGGFTITAPFPEGGDYKLAAGNAVTMTCTVDASLGADGAVTGSYTGTCGGEAKQGSLSGQRFGRKDRSDPSRVWLQFWDMDGNKFLYAIIPLTGSKGQPGGDFLYHKGSREGAVPTADLTIEGTRIAGAIEIDGKKPHKLTIDAVIVGDRLLFGTWTEEGVTRPLRGGFVPGVDTGPQIRNCDEEQVRLRRELQHKLYPDDSKYLPKE